MMLVMEVVVDVETVVEVAVVVVEMAVVAMNEFSPVEAVVVDTIDEVVVMVMEMVVVVRFDRSGGSKSTTVESGFTGGREGKRRSSHRGGGEESNATSATDKRP
ncbi:hypothetical protein Bca4012_044911 [Brassica carinata]